MAPRALLVVVLGAQKLLVKLTDLLNSRLELLIVGQTTLHMSNLLFAETDLASASTGMGDGENRYGMSFAAIALGTARAVTDDALEQGAAEDVPGAGEGLGEAIAFAEGCRVLHYR